VATLAGKAVWLTGASSGIGEALAAELARRRCRLALTARRGERLEELATALRDDDRQVVVLPGDVTDRERMLDLGEELRAMFGAVDLAILGAGTYVPVTPDTFTAEVFRTHLDTNVMGTVHCIEAVLPAMRQRHLGRIAIVASVTGFAALPRAAAYGATKAFLISMSDSLRAHLVEDGVDITVVNPGFVRTPLTDQNEFEMPFVMDAPKAARIIADGLERGKAEISFPWRMAMLMKLLGALPGPLARAYVARNARRLDETPASPSQP
jgi:short-subunit dehydrogenase